MANCSAYPEKEEMWAIFTAAGLMSGPATGNLAALDWDGFLESAIAEWDRITKKSPYLAITDTREFATPDLSSVVTDPYGQPARNISIDTGIVSVTEVRLFRSTMYGQVDTSGSGILLAQNVDYRLTPVGAPGRGTGPYTGIMFHTGHGFIGDAGESGILRITGKFGYSETIPANVRRMVLNLAMLDAAPILHAAKIAAAGVTPGIKVRKKIAGAEKEVSATGQTAGFYMGGEDEKRRIRRQMVAAAAGMRIPVLK